MTILTKMIAKSDQKGFSAGGSLFSDSLLRVGYWITGILFLLSSTASAAADSPFLEEPHQSMPPTFKDRSKEEMKVSIPPYPKDADLIKIPFNQSDARLHYFLDAATLTVGKDGIVNYTLVARSNSGAKNVAFERMHCSNTEYKVVAYATSKGAFRPVRKQRWQKVRESTNRRFRLDLWEFYLCDTESGRIRSAKQIIDAIRFYRGDRRDRGFLAPR